SMTKPMPPTVANFVISRTRWWSPYQTRDAAPSTRGVRRGGGAVSSTRPTLRHDAPFVPVSTTSTPVTCDGARSDIGRFVSGGADRSRTLVRRGRRSDVARGRHGGGRATGPDEPAAGGGAGGTPVRAGGLA